MDNQPITQPTNRRALKITGIVILILIALGGIGYAVYAYQHNRTLGSKLDDANATVQDLQNQVAQQAAADELGTVLPTNSGNTFTLRELNASVTLPDSLDDVTYSYLGNDTLGFSTVAFTNQAAACSSSSTTAPLGNLAKTDGQYVAGVTSGELIEQFSTYYIVYTSPQSICSDNINEQTWTATLANFKEALATITEL